MRDHCIYVVTLLHVVRVSVMWLASYTRKIEKCFPLRITFVTCYLHWHRRILAFVFVFTDAWNSAVINKLLKSIQTCCCCCLGLLKTDNYCAVWCRQAGCTPFAASLISDYFTVSQRALALGFYNWGIYAGYSMSYAIGNHITLALVGIF